MTNICFYFQVHQPYRLRKYTLFDVGKKQDYFDAKKNRDIMRKVAKKSYLPTNKTIKQLIRKHPDFKVTYSISGTAIDQMREYSPSVLTSFQELADTGNVEMLNETYYHSLSALYDHDEFKHQVKMHRKMVKKEFGQKPKVFRNTELIYNNAIAKNAEQLGYKAILAEGWDPVLGWRSPNYIYKAKGSNIKLLLKNYRLSDDIAFRFSNQNWKDWPLTADKYASWVSPMLGDTVNLFMDYETFGEHQWADSGIFTFLKSLPEALKAHNLSFHTPSELLNVPPKDEIDVHHPISWADVERDTSAWLGNNIQQNSAQTLYALKQKIMRSRNKQLIEAWRKLTTSDHLYYMCTKWFEDGDVHKYFNPYDSPYECFMNFMNTIQDMNHRMKRKPRLLALHKI